MAKKKHPRTRWTNRPLVHKVLDEWPLLTVIFGLVAGLAIVWSGHWRAGSTLIGLAVTLGGVLRLLLPRDVAKLLSVRSRLWDVVAMLGGGVVILVLAWIVPAQT